MSDVVLFPGHRSDDSKDHLHAEAFRNMESSISDRVTMDRIAAQCMSDADNGNQELAFSVFHLRDTLRGLMKEYYARFHGEKRGTS